MDPKGNPVPDALVSLLPASGDQPFMEGPGARTTLSGHDGRFAFWNLAPGTYSLWAWQQLDVPSVATYPPFLHAFQSKAIQIQALNPADAGYVVKLDFVSRDEVAQHGW